MRFFCFLIESFNHKGVAGYRVTLWREGRRFELGASDLTEGNPATPTLKTSLTEKVDEVFLFQPLLLQRGEAEDGEGRKAYSIYSLRRYGDSPPAGACLPIGRGWYALRTWGGAIIEERFFKRNPVFPPSPFGHLRQRRTTYRQLQTQNHITSIQSPLRRPCRPLVPACR